MRRSIGKLAQVVGLVLCTFWVAAVARAEARGPIYVIGIDETIERGLAAFLRRALDEAADVRARAVVLEINTPGGRVDAALAMRDALVGSETPTIAFVNRQAYSAGALIAIAADEIWMTPGAVLGAATPGGGSGEKAPEKIVSAVSGAFASTAETRGKDPNIARAMVDEDVAIEGVTEKGKLLTLTTEEAKQLGYADGEAASLEQLLAKKGWAGSAVVRLTPSLAERVARFFTHPVVAPILMSLGMLGLLFELKTPGWGVGGTVGLLCLALFFWGHMVAGLAGFEAVVLVAVGVVLIALEVFVIPGFGVAGVLGILAFGGGLFLALIGEVDTVTGPRLLEAAAMLAGSLCAVVVGLWAMLKYLPRTHRMSGLVLLDKLAPETLAQAGSPAAEAPEPSLMGARGTALTDLRPAGTAVFEGRRVDVVSEGEYIAKGSAVEIIEDRVYRRVVRAVPPSAGGTTPEIPRTTT